MWNLGIMNSFTLEVIVTIVYKQSWCVFIKRPENFTGPKGISKTPTRLFCRIKIEITAKFRDTEHLRFEDTTRKVSGL